MANKSTQYGQPNGNTPHELTVEEQRKGAKASHEKHRQNKSWADILKRLGDLPVKSEKNIKIMKDAGITSDELISDVQKMFILNKKADAGDLKAIETIARIRGELAPIRNQNENYEMEAPAPRLAKDRTEKQEKKED